MTLNKARSAEGIARTNLCEVVTDKLYRDITEGKYRVGERLPTHDELARRWAVSRVTIREAIKKLEALELVATHHGKGTFVLDNTKARETSFSVPLILDAQTVMQLVESRMVLETALVRFAADRHTQQDLEALEELIGKMDAARSRDDSLEYAVFDSQFHRAISKMAGNPVLYSVMEQLRNYIEDQQRDMFEYSSSLNIRFRDRSFQDHLRIARFIRNRDADGAEKAMREHIERVMKLVQDFYRTRGAGKARAQGRTGPGAAQQGAAEGGAG